MGTAPGGTLNPLLGGDGWCWDPLFAQALLRGFSGCCSPDVLFSYCPPDVRGLWLFRLDRHSRVNYRLQCLTWLQAQPPPSTWSMELPPCPCSQPQAELDPRYRRSRSAESPPAPEVAAVPQNTSDLFVTVLRTTSPSRMGAGVRCVYRGTGLLEGWLERFWSPPTDPLDSEWAPPCPGPKTPAGSACTLQEHWDPPHPQYPATVCPQMGSWRRLNGAAGKWGSLISAPGTARRDQELAVRNMCHLPLVGPLPLWWGTEWVAWPYPHRLYPSGDC